MNVICILGLGNCLTDVEENLMNFFNFMKIIKKVQAHCLIQFVSITSKNYIEQSAYYLQ